MVTRTSERGRGGGGTARLEVSQFHAAPHRVKLWNVILESWEWDCSPLSTCIVP